MKSLIIVFFVLVVVCGLATWIKPSLAKWFWSASAVAFIIWAIDVALGLIK